MFKTGLVHVYVGDGQGKTCAAVGLAMRACGGGCKVLFAQFLKNCRSGELRTMEKLPEQIKILTGKPCEKFFKDMDPLEQEEAIREQHDSFIAMQQEIETGKYDMLIMDEVVDAVCLGMIGIEEFLDFLRHKPMNLEVAVTGHEFIPGLMEIADYVSEVKKIKHPYDRGVQARKGADL